MYLIRLPYKNLNFVYAGGYTTCFTHKGPPDFVVNYIPDAKELLKRHQETGRIVNCGANSMMGAAAFMGGGGVAWFEQFMFHDPALKESREEGFAVVSDSAKFSREHQWPGTYEGVNGTDQQKRDTMLASNQPEVYRWQRKIKEAFDPNEVGDGNYASLD